MLKFLGRGSAFNTKEGNTAAYIKEDGCLLLIDCGSNIFEKIISRGLLDDVTEVNVAITHRHPDHVGSLGDLIFYCFFKKKIKVNLWSEDYYLTELLLLNGVTRDKYEFKYSGNIGKMNATIRFVYANHTGVYKNAQGEISEQYSVYERPIDLFSCYSIIIEKEGKSLFYSGDVKYVPWWDEGNHDIYYIDTCFADYPDNVHYNVDHLLKDIQSRDESLINKVWCMHLDSDQTITRAKECGFNVVENE
jgi:ribonuclease BN (tRNA processing enzyme)